jgi:hypothetical protein
MIEAIIEAGEPDAEKKNCYDCRSCKAAVSWWCINKGAVKFRGTAIPGVNNCQFWEPCRKVSDLSISEKLFGDFIKIRIQ